MKKVELKLEFYADKVKQKAMQKASGISGVESISIDMNEKKMTVCGEMDPVKVISKLRKVCPTDMIFFGPVVVKEPEESPPPPPPSCPYLPPLSPKKKDDEHEDYYLKSRTWSF